MKKRKLQYVFHNPNTEEVTADYLLKILIESNSKKVEELIQTAAETVFGECQNEEKYPA